MCNKNETRKSLIKAGLSLFSQKGFHAVGINEIVKLSGIPKGSFYNYFASKEVFVSEVLKTAALLNRKKVNQTDGSDDEVRLIIRLLAEAIARSEPGQAHSGLLFANNAGTLSQTSDALRNSLNVYIEQSLATVRMLLTSAQEKGSIRTDLSVEQITSFFWDAWQGAVLRAQVEQSAQPLHQVIQFIFEEFVYRD